MQSGSIISETLGKHLEHLTVLSAMTLIVVFNVISAYVQADSKGLVNRANQRPSLKCYLANINVDNETG